MSNYSGPDLFEEATSCGVGITESVERTKSTRKMLVTDGATDLAQETLPKIQTQSNLHIKSAVVCSRKTPETPSEDVTEKFIADFNSHRGNQEKVDLAWKMLKYTRRLAGLDGGSIYVDVPSARHNLFLLSGLNHQELKMSALKSLIQALEADQIQRESAFDLVVLAMDLMKQMNRELVQTQLVEVQITICQAYGIVTELVQRHYAKRHLGGITKELKEALIQTAKTLEDLNTHEDSHLHFAVEYALEGVKRLRDDRKELFDAFDRIYHGLMALVALKIDDPAILADSLTKVFQGLDFRLYQPWYDSTMLFNEIAKKASGDNYQLMLLQYLVQDETLSLDWKFTYNAIMQFGKIALHGSTPEIRMAALIGQKFINAQTPGIIDFIDCHKFPAKTDFKPIVHFKAPVSKDVNLSIRRICIKTLIQIAQEANDASLRKKAKQLLCLRSKNEEDPIILETITSVIPKKTSDKNLWINEEGAFAFNPSDKYVEEKLAIEIQTLVNHYLHLTLDPSKAEDVTTAITDKKNQIRIQTDVLYQIGKTYLALGHLDKGEQALLKAVKLQPKNYKTHLLLSVFYREQNKLEEANFHAEKARGLKPLYNII